MRRVLPQLIRDDYVTQRRPLTTKPPWCGTLYIWRDGGAISLEPDRGTKALERDAGTIALDLVQATPLVVDRDEADLKLVTCC